MDDITFALQYAENKTPYGSESITRDIGFTGVFGYTYDDRFLADLTIRENASSQFGQTIVGDYSGAPVSVGMYTMKNSCRYWIG